MAETVPLIQHSQSAHAYNINFKKYLQTEEASPDVDLSQRVYDAVKSLFHFIGVVFHATLNSAYATIRDSPSSFRHLVLSSYGITDLYIAGFKVAFWVFGLGYTFVATASRTVAKEYFPENREELRRHMPEGMDLRHIQATDVTLDASGVPEVIQVNNLLALFEEIEFEDASKPEYIPSTFYKEDEKAYTRGDLQRSLNTFVTNVNERTAFMGTPPVYDRIKLLAFYQQIEDAVRLSIQKVSEDLTTFREKNQVAIDAGEEGIIKEYKNLLEDQARLVIDLAISGKHCGARYMGETMTRYNYLYSESAHSDTLADSLITLLGARRNAVAHAQIQRRFGGQALGPDTHSYAQYMQQMGRVLAIPGTENIVEHLGGYVPFDRDYYLEEFFKEYTEDDIEKAVQEKVKSSQHFREQIYDWLKAQSAEWSPEGQDNVATSKEKQLQDIIDGGVETSQVKDLIRKFEELLTALKENRAERSSSEEEEFYRKYTRQGRFDVSLHDWGSFIQDLIVLPKAKEWFNGKQDDLENLAAMQKQIQLMTRRQAFMEELTNPVLASVLRNYALNESPVSFENLQDDLTKITKVKQMREILPLDGRVFMRILNQEAELSTVVQDHFRVSNESKFLRALGLDTIHEDGLPPLILKWLLCAHQISVPGKPEERVDLQEDVVIEEGLRYFLDQVGPGRNGLALEGKNAALDKLFDTAFRAKPNEVSKAAESALPSREPFYPRWKTIVCINIPKSGAEFFRSPLLQYATSIFLVYKTVQFMKKAYAYNNTLVDRAKLYLEKNMSTKTKTIALKTQATFSDWYHWVLNNRLRLFIYVAIGREILANSPFAAVRRLGRRINPLLVLPNLLHMYNFFIEFGFAIVSLGLEALNQISSSLRSLSNQSQQERNRVSRKISYSLWRDNAGYSEVPTSCGIGFQEE